MCEMSNKLQTVKCDGEELAAPSHLSFTCILKAKTFGCSNIFFLNVSLLLGN